MTEKQGNKEGRIKQYLLFNFTTILTSATCLSFAVVVAFKDKLLFPALLFAGIGICFLAIFIWDCVKYWRWKKLVELREAILKEKSAEEK